MDSSTAEQLATLFAGMTDRVGLLHPDGRYESRETEHSFNYAKGHFLHRHAPAVGIYPIYEFAGRKAHARWGCIDIDHGDKGIDGLPIARNCVKVGEVLKLYGFIEKTKSPMCYHVWYFTRDSLVSSADWRDALLLVNEVAGAESKEVNPKQSVLAAGELGNFVNLPYPEGRWRTFDGMAWFPVSRYMCDSYGEAYTPEQFLAKLRYTDSNDIAAAAQRWRAIEAARPKPVPIYTAPSTPVDGGEIVNRLNGLAFKILNEGVLPGNDRSGTLFKLALECRKSGLAPYETAEVIRMADHRWAHKFYKRADGERQIERIVSQVFS